MEVTEEKKEGSAAGARPSRCRGCGRGDGCREAQAHGDHGGNGSSDARQADDRFAGHFDQLLSEANIPGPDYYEFSRMIGVMQGIPDEGARYSAAFAGLQVQGLDKQRLLTTAGEYLRILDTDARNQFQQTVDAALQEKVHGKEKEAEEKAGPTDKK
jgi:hypothetical protein